MNTTHLNALNRASRFFPGEHTIITISKRRWWHSLTLRLDWMREWMGAIA